MKSVYCRKKKKNVSVIIVIFSYIFILYITSLHNMFRPNLLPLESVLGNIIVIF